MSQQVVSTPPLQWESSNFFKKRLNEEWVSWRLFISPQDNYFNNLIELFAYQMVTLFTMGDQSNLCSILVTLDFKKKYLLIQQTDCSILLPCQDQSLTKTSQLSNLQNTLIKAVNQSLTVKTQNHFQKPGKLVNLNSSISCCRDSH